MSGDRHIAEGSGWHSLAARPALPTPLSTCLRQLPVRPLEDWTTEGSFPCPRLASHADVIFLEPLYFHPAPFVVYLDS